MKKLRAAFLGIYLSVFLSMVLLVCNTTGPSDDPLSQQTQLTFKVPDTVAADRYRISITTDSGKSIIYFETAHGTIISISVPANSSSVVTVEAYKTDPVTGQNVHLFTGQATVQPLQRGLVQLTEKPIEKPKAPEGIAANPTADSKALITWAASAGAERYKIFRTLDPEGALEPIGSATQCTFTDQTVVAGMTYFFCVTALNSAGESVPSDFASFLIPVVVTPPDAPQGVAATPVSTSQIDVTWTPVASVTGYIVYGGTSAAGLIEIGTPTTASFSHGNLIAGTTYFYEVVAVNASGASPRSTMVSAIIQTAVPAAPTGVAATASGTSITVTWSAVTGATGYTVYGGTSSANLTQLGTTATETYTQSNLTPGTTYYYAVAAINAAGTSNRSVTTSATAQGGTPPAAPTGVAAKDSGTSITVTWSAVTGATGYIVYGGTSSANLTQLGTPTTATYTQSNLTAGTTYYYAVAAVNASGTSPRSTTISAAIQVAVPAAPTGVAATATSSTAINVTWNAVTGATSYIIYRGTTSTSLSQVGTAATTSFSNTGLTASTMYYFAVAAVNAGGTGARSTTVSATTQSSGPAVPTGVTTTVASSTSITVKWTAVTGAASYIIYRGATSVSLSQVGTATTTTYTNTGLKASTTYYYAVAAVNASGTSARSTTVSATTSASTLKAYITQCRGCDRCRNACSKGALKASGNVYVIDPALCDGCGDCVPSCPYGYIVLR
jgi:fibronectin type 3 domain-containing protein/NAD-dependent dihydropyrimidine dehydrogenase PreA subunit